MSARKLPAVETASWPDPFSFEGFVRRYGPSLLRLATLLLGNRSDAEDVLQESLIAAAAQWSRIRPETAPAYVRKIISNKAVDLMRRRKELLVETVPDAPVEDLAFLRFEDDREFFSHLRQVQGRQRAILVLRYYEDVSDVHIAKLLGCTSSTVRSQAARALAKLREAMEVKA